MSRQLPHRPDSGTRGRLAGVWTCRGPERAVVTKVMPRRAILFMNSPMCMAPP